MPGKSKAKGKYGFGKKSSEDLHDVTLPSGGTVQARRPGVSGLLRLGLLDHFDELTAIVQTTHIDPKNPKPAKVTAAAVKAATDEMTVDADKLASAFHLVDRVVTGIVVQPPVWIDYQVKDESDEDFAKRAAKAEVDEAEAIREVDLEDKMFLLEWSVGGANDLKAFREGTGELMADMAAS